MFDPIANFRERLDAGETLIGTTVVLADPLSTDAIARSVDFIWYDQEHTQMSHEVLRTHLIAARGRDCPGIVRVPKGSTSFVKPVLDAGASGVIAPQIKTVEEVQQLISDCRYTPIGQRGFGPLIPTNYGQDEGPAYIKKSNENILAAIMIETVEAVEAIHEIVSVKGLDSIVIGPMDLSSSLGVLGNLEHPKVINAMDKVISSAREAGVYVGAGLGLDSSYGLFLIDRGVQWLQMGCDIIAMSTGIDMAIKEVRCEIPQHR